MPKFLSVNWKTSLNGFGVILAAVGAAMIAAFDGNPETVVDWNVVVLAVLTGIGLIKARDWDKTSKQSGAK